MKFLVDAQLPRRLVALLREYGHDAIHTLDLPQGNQSTDAFIITVADREDRIVISKDDDFVSSFLLRRTPRKLLLVSTGNISNRDLLDLVRRNLPILVSALTEADFIEITGSSVITRI
jgi:predicted nuclease of predicted toxin-antitoxin system